MKFWYQLARRPGIWQQFRVGRCMELPQFGMDQPFHTKQNRALVTPSCIFELFCLAGLYDVRTDNDAFKYVEKAAYYGAKKLWSGHNMQLLN